MKKFNWFKFLKGIIYIFIAITFLSVRFYDIQEIIVYNGIEYTRSSLNYAAFLETFEQIFKVVYYNILFFILFLALGILEMIGVRKNG